MNLPSYFYEGSFEPFREELVQGKPRKKAKKGDVLNQVGDYMDCTYYVHEGILRFYIINTETGTEKTEWFVGSGGLFPLYSPVGRHYRMERDNFLVTVQEDAIVTKISQEEIENLLKKNSKFAISMLKQYADLSSILLYEAITLSTTDTNTKICNYLWQYVRLLVPKGVRLSQEEQAENCGVSRIAYARCLQKLREEGIVETTRKGIEVLDWEGLEAHCNPDLLEEVSK